MRGENRWPTESLPGFEQCLSDYFRRLRSFGRVLARNVALSLELPEDFFDKDLTHPGCSAVIAHYPPQPPKTDHFGIDPHSDSECKQRFSPSFANRGRWLTVHIVFTILAPGEVRALEVLNKRGEWVSAPPRRGAFIINIGDQLQSCKDKASYELGDLKQLNQLTNVILGTNGLYVSTTHRVANLSGLERYSVPFFFSANFECVIKVYILRSYT